MEKQSFYASDKGLTRTAVLLAGFRLPLDRRLSEFSDRLSPIR